MSTLKILKYPQKGLREIAPIVTQFDDALRQTVKEMFEKMYADQGCGLAATQLGLSLRLFVMDTSPQQNQPICIINPEIISKEGESISEEGCLSFPGVYARVMRATKVTVNYQDEFGQPQTMTADGLTSHCIQHESEHLDGVLFIDHFSKLKRMMMLKKLEKVQKAAAAE
ncbi:MAG: peptide deformylase [Gammaproteobacteria bacterium 39-13]|nr:peptide deformylase [Gammaproteobacteria bacterium]OJV90728.1 MAG: peptide deformylase [Gammaproteobacteria bacterium 39-13]